MTVYVELSVASDVTVYVAKKKYSTVDHGVELGGREEAPDGG